MGDRRCRSNANSAAKEIGSEFCVPSLIRLRRIDDFNSTKPFADAVIDRRGRHEAAQRLKRRVCRPGGASAETLRSQVGVPPRQSWRCRLPVCRFSRSDEHRWPRVLSSSVIANARMLAMIYLERIGEVRGTCCWRSRPNAYRRNAGGDLGVADSFVAAAREIFDYRNSEKQAAI
jgi:hypothetical protein